MIGIQMKMPDSCVNCPMSYWIQSGKHEGLLMCNVIEKMLSENGETDLDKCLVDEWSQKRPNKCPLLELGLSIVKG